MYCCSHLSITTGGGAADYYKAPPHTLHGREGIKKTCKKLLDVTAAVAECENSLRGYDLERKLSEAGICKAISDVELGCFRGWDSSKERQWDARDD